MNQGGVLSTISLEFPKVICPTLARIGILSLIFPPTPIIVLERYEKTEGEGSLPPKSMTFFPNLQGSKISSKFQHAGEQMRISEH